MPSITMCRGDRCPIAKCCYRHTATPCERGQAYFPETPRCDDELGCMYFLGNGTTEPAK